MSGSILDKVFASVLSSIDDESVRAELEAQQKGFETLELPDELCNELAEEELASESIYAQLRDMSMARKIKLALVGNKLARTLLMRDSSRQVAVLVLENPRITEQEVFEAAGNVNIDDSILRAIGENRSWMKSYATKWALVSNPKTPIDISLKWLKFLNPKELERLSKSKGIPQVVASQSRKLVEKRNS